MGKGDVVLGLVAGHDRATATAATRAVLHRLDRGQLSTVETRDVLAALGLLPATSPPADDPTPAPAPVAEPPPTAPIAGLVVWEVPGGYAHWPSDCPDRAGQIACSSARVDDMPSRPVAVPPDRVPADRRCRSVACASRWSRWRQWAAGQPLRIRCPRCKTVHEETARTH